MPAGRIELIDVEEARRPAWRLLYDGYATFYKREMTDEIAARVWGWLLDPGHELEGRLALLDGQPVGLTHFRRMPSPLRGADIGFLDDLFVSPEARGSGAAEALFADLKRIAGTRGWPFVRWITADDNYRARGLYDRIAKKTSWNLYEMQV